LRNQRLPRYIRSEHCRMPGRPAILLAGYSLHQYLNWSAFRLVSDMGYGYPVSFSGENMAIPYIQRRKEEELRQFINDPGPHKNVLMVEGARQVGKTWMVEHVLAGADKPKVSVNLERDPRLLSLIDDCQDFGEFTELLQDRLDFRPDAPSILFIDEAQEARKLGGFVRFMKEEWSQAPVILSGSTLRRIFRDGTRYPVGRVQHLCLAPFSFSEFLRALGQHQLAEAVLPGGPEISSQRHEHLLSLFDRFLEVGGLPAIVLAGVVGEGYADLRAGLIADYERDFVRLFGEEHLGIVRACFRSVANFVGAASKNTSVVPSPSNRVNEKINEVFARLEAWRLIHRSDQRGPSPESSHQYLPKRYLFDTGVLRHLRETAVPSISVINTLSSAARTPLGGVLENQAAIALAQRTEPLTGWKKTPSGGEIDFVVKKGEGAVPVECKAALSINKRHLRGILDYLERYDLPCGMVVSFAPFEVMELGPARRVVNLPAYLLERLPEFAE